MNMFRSCKKPSSFRPRLETLEDRNLLSFGTEGLVITNNLEGVFYDGAIQDDGKIVAVGTSNSPLYGGFSYVAARYLPSGALDTTFNSTGVIPGTVAVPSGRKVAIEEDGKIVLAGVSAGESVLCRLLSDGTFDPSFGSNGVVTWDPPKGANFEPTDFALGIDGKVVVAGWASKWGSGDNFYVLRYNSDGSLDTSFDGDGVVINYNSNSKIPLLAPSSVIVQTNGKIVVTGTISNPYSKKGIWYRNTDIGLVRYNSDGSLDTTFGNKGVVVTDFKAYTGNYANSLDEVKEAQLQADGKIVVVGGTNTFDDTGSKSHLIVARYNTNGSLDSSFGVAGNVLFEKTGGTHRFKSVLIQPGDQKIIATTDGADYLPASTRLNPNGSLDTSFDTKGWATEVIGAIIEGQQYYFERLEDTLLQEDGKIVYVGFEPVGVTGVGALARLNPDGSIDVGSPLVAASLPATAATESLTVTPLLHEAISRFVATGTDISALCNFQITIRDLGGNLLGLASGNTIYLDDNAAGWGWFVDPTPHDDLEFMLPGDQGEQGRMDLLSVIMHEMGHVLGYEHEAGGLMQENLFAGQRQGMNDPYWFDSIWAILTTEKV